MAEEAKKTAWKKALVEKFKTVSAGRLERLNLALLELEKDPGRRETAADAMREIHTLKGEAKLVGFGEVSTLAHRTEELMLFAREHGFEIGAEVFDTILGGFDAMGTLLHPEDGHDFDLESFTARVKELKTREPEPVPESETSPRTRHVASASAASSGGSPGPGTRSLKRRRTC